MLTINEGMVLQKAVGSRVAELKALRAQVAIKNETMWYREDKNNDKKDTIEPQFDVKKVDKKIVELELFLFKLESKIKQTNAMTKIDIEADVDKLLSPLE